MGPLSHKDTDVSTKKIFGLQKNVFLLGLVSFFNDLSSEMILSIFPAFFISVLKAGAASLGLVEGVAEGASNIIKIFAGRLSDRINKRRPFIFAGYSLSVIIRPFYILMKTIGGVASLRVADRIGKGLREGPRDAIISLSVPKEEIGKSFGYHRGMDTAGALVGPFIAFLILRHTSTAFNTVFVTSFIAGLFAIAAILFIKDVAGNWSRGNSAKMALGSLLEYSREFKIYLLVIFILSIGSLPIAVLLLKTSSLHFALYDIPLFYMLYNFSYAAFSMWGGALSDKIGGRKVITLGYAILIFGYILLGFSEGLALLVISFLVLGLFPALTDGVQRAYASTLTDDTHKAGAYGLMNAAIGFGAIISGILGGFIWQKWGIPAALIFAGASVIVGLVIFFFTRTKTPEVIPN